MRFKLKKSIMAAAIMGAVFSSSAQADYSSSVFDKQIETADDLLSLQREMARMSVEKQGEVLSSTIKLRSMYDYSKTVAIRAGIESRIKEIKRDLAGNERSFDAIYNFEPLMINQRVIPPVITEARNLFNQTSPNVLVIAKARYEISKQARFSSIAPNWRDYFNFPVDTSAYKYLSYGGQEMIPKTRSERTAWESGTKEGFKIGRKEADNILKKRMQLLNRDYIGMVRFHKMVNDGRITMPIVDYYQMHDSLEGNAMVLDKNMLKIRVMPKFKQKPIVTYNENFVLERGEKVILDTEANVSKIPLLKDLTMNSANKQEKYQAAEINKRVQKVVNNQKFEPSSYNASEVVERYIAKTPQQTHTLIQPLDTEKLNSQLETELEVNVQTEEEKPLTQKVTINIDTSRDDSVKKEGIKQESDEEISKAFVSGISTEVTLLTKTVNRQVVELSNEPEEKEAHPLPISLELSKSEELHKKEVANNRNESNSQQAFIITNGKSEVVQLESAPVVKRVK